MRDAPAGTPYVIRNSGGAEMTQATARIVQTKLYEKVALTQVCISWGIENVE